MNRIIFKIGMLISIVLLASACQTDVSDIEVDYASYYTLTNKLHDFEKANQLFFLKADGKYRESFWGDKFKLDVEVENSANQTVYKDITLRVQLYSETDTHIGTEETTIYRKINPNTKQTFAVEIPKYQDVKKLGWEVISASVVE